MQIHQAAEVVAELAVASNDIAIISARSPGPEGRRLGRLARVQGNAVARQYANQIIQGDKDTLVARGARPFRHNHQPKPQELLAEDKGVHTVPKHVPGGV